MDVRKLSADEWSRLAPIYEAHGEPLPPSENNAAIVAEVNGEIVGMVGLNLIVHVGPLYVAPEHRGKGLSDAMIAEAEKQIREFGGSHYLMFPSNRFSEAVCRRVGLKEEPWKVFSGGHVRSD